MGSVFTHLRGHADSFYRVRADIDFTYPTPRVYYHASEGKSGAPAPAAAPTPAAPEPRR